MRKGSPETLWILSPWRYSKPHWTALSKCSGNVGLDDFQRALLTSAILCLFKTNTFFLTTFHLYLCLKIFLANFYSKKMGLRNVTR